MIVQFSVFPFLCLCIVHVSVAQRSSWEGTKSSASLEIPPFARDIKVYYCVHKKITPTHMLTRIHTKIVGNRFYAHLFIRYFLCVDEQFTPVCKEVKFMILCKEWAVGLYIFPGMWKCNVILFLLLFRYLFSLSAGHLFDHFIYCSWMTCIVLHLDLWLFNFL
jgi:hypothetical protein